MNRPKENRAVGTGLSCLTKLLLFFVGVPLLLIVCTVIWWFSRQSIARGELDRRIAQLAADGMPFDDASLQIYYSQQTNSDWSDAWVSLLDQVARPEFENAARDIPIVGFSEDPIPKPGEPWSQKEAVRKFLQDQDWIVQQMDDMAPHLERVRLPIQFQGPSTLLTHVQQTRSLARLMSLRHELALHDANSEEAAKSVLATLAIARALEGDAILVSHLVCIAIRGVATTQLRNGLQNDVYTLDQLKSIAASMDRSSPSNDRIRDAFIGERAFVLTHLEMIASGNSTGGNTVQSTMMSVPHNSLATLEMFEETLQALPPGSEFDADALVRLAEQADQHAPNDGWLNTLDRGLADMLTPALSSCLNAFVRDAMDHRLARLAIELRILHDGKSAWPDSLEEATKDSGIATSLRPIGGKPFGYRVNADASLSLWGFPTHDTPDLKAMTETPDDPPVTSDPWESWWLYQLSSPKSIE